MKLKMILCSTIMGTALLFGTLTCSAESTGEFEQTELTYPATTYVTDDGVLSIEAPSDEWFPLEDPKYWFALTDGDDLITVSHLSNGENLPPVEVANDDYGAIYQAFVSTKNEVFVVKGSAVKAEELEDIMRSIGTIQVLKFDTKTAVGAETVKASAFALREINETYYVTAESLNVRTGVSTDDAIMGTLSYGQGVTVKGAVTKDGEDYGWYQIDYNGTSAYASAHFLSKTKPEEKKEAPKKSEETQVQTEAAPESFTVYAENGGNVDIFPVGDHYEDYNGLTYTNIRGDLYYDILNEVVFSADPDYWVNGEPQPDVEYDYDTDDYDDADDAYEYEEDDDYDDAYDYEEEDYD